MSRTSRRATAAVVGEAMKQVFPEKEAWVRDRWFGPIGFVYRHSDALGRHWIVRGVWPSTAAALIATALLLGVFLGWRFG